MKKLTEALTPLFHVFLVIGICVPQTYQPPRLVKILRYVYMIADYVFVIIMTFFLLGFVQLISDDHHMKFYKHTALFLNIIAHSITEWWLYKNRDNFKMLLQKLDLIMFPESVLRNAKLNCIKLLMAFAIVPFIHCMPLISCLLTSGVSSYEKHGLWLTCLMVSLTVISLSCPIFISFSMLIIRQIVLGLVPIVNSSIIDTFEYWVTDFKCQKTTVGIVKMMHQMCNVELMLRDLYKNMQFIFSPIMALHCLIVIHGQSFWVVDTVTKSEMLTTTVNNMYNAATLLATLLLYITFQTNTKLNRKVS